MPIQPTARRVLPFLALAFALGACSIIPPSLDPTRQTRVPRQEPAVSRPAVVSGSQCVATLRRTGATIAARPPLDGGPGCSVANVVDLDAVEVGGRRVAVTSLDKTSCTAADAFVDWARSGVAAAARRHFGSDLARIETMGSYSCRNVAGTSRRSAHSTADAIDVSGFVLADGRRITLLAAWNGGTPAEQAFLRDVHRAGCRSFGMVLGPDYNASHRDHFHLERAGQNFCR